MPLPDIFPPVTITNTIAMTIIGHSWPFLVEGHSALLHLANENVFSCLWRRRCTALSSLQSTELQDFSAAVGTFFRRDERKGNIFPSLTRHLPTLWRAIPTTFFSGMEPLPLQSSRIFRESFHFTHIRSHTHTSFAEPHLMLIKIVSSNFFTTCRRFMCDMCWACFA